MLRWGGLRWLACVSSALPLQRAGEIPIHFGRRFHVVEGVSRPWEALDASEGEGKGVQAGDFVRWEIPEGMDDASIKDSLVSEQRSAGPQGLWLSRGELIPGSQCVLPAPCAPATRAPRP